MSGNSIQLNQDLIKNNLNALSRYTLEEMLNELFYHEADELGRAANYEHSRDPNGFRSGNC